MLTPNLVTEIPTDAFYDWYWTQHKKIIADPPTTPNTCDDAFEVDFLWSMRDELTRYGLSEGATGLCLLLESNKDIESLVRRFLTELFDFLGKQPTNLVEVRIAQINPEETTYHSVDRSRTNPDGIVYDTIERWEVHHYKAAMVLPIKFEDLRNWAAYQADQLRSNYD